jgi:hypothetical protein
LQATPSMCTCDCPTTSDPADCRNARHENDPCPCLCHHVVANADALERLLARVAALEGVQRAVARLVEGAIDAPSA